MRLREKYRDLILALQEDPLATYAELSQKMNIAPATAKSRLKQLWSQDSTNSIVEGISGNLDPNKINLSTSTFLIDMENDTENYQTLFDLNEYHPYTFYQNRIFGTFTGFLIQFNSPIGSENLLHDLFSQLKDDLKVLKINKFHNPDLVANIYPDFQTLMKTDWDFDFNDWLESGITEDTGDLNDYPIIDNNKLPDYKSQIELGHIIVIRELMINGRRKQSRIMDDIKKNEHYSDTEKEIFHYSNQRNISRYFDFVRQHQLILDYQLHFNRNKFGLFQQFCFTGELKDGFKEKITKLLKTKSTGMPFRMGLSFKENNYFIYLEASPTISNRAIDFIQGISSQMNTMLIDGSFRYQRNYPIWHRNYVKSSKGWNWNASRQWMVDLPISNIIN